MDRRGKDGVEADRANRATLGLAPACWLPPGVGGARWCEKPPNGGSFLHRYTFVRALLLASSLVFATVASGSAFAQSTALKTTTPTMAATQSPDATAAEGVVNTFMADLASGQLDAARQLMTTDAIVMANGIVLGDRDGYFNGPAKGDIEALRNTQRELLHRSVKTGGDMGWVVSEKRVRHAGTDQGPREIVVTETMLLAKTAGGWKISHIHWSTRAVG